MPIEKEFKFILQNDGELEAYLINNRAALKLSYYDSMQGYLSKSGRLRYKKWQYQYGQIVEELRDEYFFTYKHPLENGQSVIELEYPMTKSDFDLAWPECNHIITKTRFIIGSGLGSTWEIDFFKKDVHTYFVMAECEVPSDQDAPEILHPVVAANLLYAVPSSDRRFQNRKLNNVSKVRKLLREIVDGPAT